MTRKNNPNLSPRLYNSDRQLYGRNPSPTLFSDQTKEKQSSLTKVLQWALKLFCAGVVFLVFQFFPDSPVETSRSLEQVWGIEKRHVADSISEDIFFNEYPSLVRIATDDYDFDGIVHYNIDIGLNRYVDDLILRYKPDYAAVVAIQPQTGEILTMSSFVRNKDDFSENLALHSGFPAASVFKIVTAAAAIDTGIAKPDSIYQYNGKNTSLYKSNVLRHNNNKWTRDTSLRRAFALSINTVFGRIGVFDLGAENLQRYADKFGFNTPLRLDFPLQESKTGFSGDDEWTIAEAASGYTRATTISPVHAAMIGGIIANDGVLVEPSLIDFVADISGPLLYQPEPEAMQVLDKKTTDDMRALMRATVEKGSARKHFRKFQRGHNANLEIGGKTGSLTGFNPQGRTEWFVGYGDSGEDKLAVAAVVVNKEKWRVKPAYLTRKVIEEYFKSKSADG